jgi:hypothetical protein
VTISPPPPIVTAAWPPALVGNSCIDANNAPTLDMFCSLTGPDVF